MLAFSLILFASAALVQGQELVQPGPPAVCLEGPFHKEFPSPEEEDFHECLSWQNEACCNLQLSMTIDRHKAVGLYNYSWDVCGTLSQQCEEFIKDEECFYQCEPMLGYFQIDMTGYIRNVPVCASYCDAWFEACRNDLTCVEDWLADFDFAIDGVNSCPANSTCVTFEQMYGSAVGLCNRMWGEAFFYSNDTDNCTVMAFDNTMNNPNYRLTFPTSGGQSISTAEVVYGTILMMSLLIAVLM